MRLNIEGLTLGVTNGGDTCRLTLTLNGDDATVEHVSKQLMKVIDVLEAQTYSLNQVTSKELALIRVSSFEASKIDCGRLECRIVDSSPHSAVLEVVGTTDEIDQFVKQLGDLVLDIARTGTAALPKEKHNE
jgi:acetolactate synthase-1/3 small subunit